MRKREFSRTYGLLHMLIHTLYFHNIQYQTDPLTQSRENWLKSQKYSILDLFRLLIMLIMRKRDYFWTCGLLQMLIHTLYFHNIRYQTDPKHGSQWLVSFNFPDISRHSSLKSICFFQTQGWKLYCFSRQNLSKPLFWNQSISFSFVYLSIHTTLWDCKILIFSW